MKTRVRMADCVGRDDIGTSAACAHTLCSGSASTSAAQYDFDLSLTGGVGYTTMARRGEAIVALTGAEATRVP
jgi:hypothetical protein